MRIGDLLRGSWERRAEPVLSAAGVEQDWCRVLLYSPTVVRQGGRYRMWYVGGCEDSRSGGTCLGYAESADGFEWAAYEGNPIGTPEDISWGMGWQTPRVIYDEDESVFKMWFTAGTKLDKRVTAKGNYQCVDMDAAVGYAVSADGIAWQVGAEPIYCSGRGPSVLKTGRDDYSMWMCSRPSS